MASQNDRIIVIGGGILGVSTAAQLAKRGTEVVLITERAIASGASGRSLSWLNSLMAPNPAYHALRVAGLDRYRQFAKTHTGSQQYLRFDGGIFWPGVGERPLSDVAAGLDSYGFDYELLSPEDAQRKGLGLNPDALPDQILFAKEEGWVDLESLIDVLLEEFHAAGGEVRTNTGKARVELKDGAVSAVVLGDGSRLATERVMVATGPDVPRMAGEAGFEIPEQTPVSVLVRTKPVEVALRAVINSPRVALRPNVGGNIVLDRSWAEAAVVKHDEDDYSLPDETVRQLLAEASHVLEGTPSLELDSYGIGPKPIPGDGHAVVGELPGVQGYHVAFTHSGATLGLILGELAADGMLGNPSSLLREFGPGRFSQS